MKTPTDDMIAALDSCDKDPDEELNVARLYEITSGFKSLPDKVRVIPALFSVIERCGHVDLGNPGPLVHCIESLGYKQYLGQLLESVRRQPRHLNVWMINRILNSKIPSSDRQQLLDVLHGVLGNPTATPGTISAAKEFIKLQEAT